MSERNENEWQLTRGLEALAADCQTPPRVKVRLLDAFRERHPRRIRWTAIAAGIAVAALLVPFGRQRAEPASLGTFIALDDGPIESGVVVRVKLPRSILGDENASGEVEADVFMGADGLAHAVRFVR